MLVHKGRIFESKDTWLYVYDGCFPDVMLSEGFLNHIPCVSHPGEKLIDTATSVADQLLLRECMTDWHDLIVQRFLQPQVTTSDLHSAHICMAGFMA